MTDALRHGECHVPAAPHGHDLVLGRYSVHTGAATLQAAEQRLREIQHRLQNEGRI